MFAVAANHWTAKREGKGKGAAKGVGRKTALELGNCSECRNVIRMAY